MCMRTPLAGLALLALCACGSTQPQRSMVGYVPPTSQPAHPKRTLVRGEPGEVWASLLAYIDQSSFAVDHLDEPNYTLVARYSGDPEPYLDCGSIVTHENGVLSQLSGASPDLALRYKLDGDDVVLKRALRLDTRMIIKLEAQPAGTVVSSTTTHVVTKSVDVEDKSGNLKEGSRETTSFGNGKRGEFGKGTACQANGRLDVALVQSLPDVIGSRILTAEEQIDPLDTTVAETDQASFTVPDIVAEPPTLSEDNTTEQVDAATIPDIEEENLDDFDWIFPEDVPSPALPPSLPAPAAETQEQAPIDDEPAVAAAEPAAEDTTQFEDVAPIEPASEEVGPASLAEDNIAAADTTAPAPAPAPASEGEVEENITNASESAAQLEDVAAVSTGQSWDNAEDAGSIVDETTKALLASLACNGDEWHFCELVTLSSPYRKANIERLLGLSINTTGSLTSQVIGSDLQLDVRLPEYPAYLHIGYLQRDSITHHILSNDKVWPPNSSHRVQGTGFTIPEPAGIAMIVAIATQEPLFEEEPPTEEDARDYVERLTARLEALEAVNDGRMIAASHLLINAEAATQ